MNPLLVITGGTKGIGLATVDKFAAEGFDIITCSRNENELEALKEQISHKYNINFRYLKADLGKKNEVARFSDFVKQQNRSVDILINNTGIFKPGKIKDEEEGKLEEMININLLSAYHLTRGLVHKMIEKSRGHIFNMCSTASIKAYPDGGAYCITKYALLGMNNVLREELKAYNIKVTAVLPGPTWTPSWEGIELPEERFMKPEDVAASIYANYALSDRTVVENILLRPVQGDL